MTHRGSGNASPSARQRNRARSATQADQSGGAPPATSDRCATVLVVEDDCRLRRVACTRLVGLGYQVLETSDAAAAIALLAEHPEVEVLFSDLVLPGEMSGLDLAKRVREQYPGVRIILTSGYAAELLHGEEHDLGLHVLLKPYSRASLERIFDDTLRAR